MAVALLIVAAVGLVPADPTITLGIGDGLEPLIITSSTPVARRMRGDWETPEAVVLTYTSAWPQVLATLLASLEGAVQVLFLLPKDEPEAEALGWLHTHARAASTVGLIDLGVDTTWIRDYGPLQVKDDRGRITWLDTDYGSRPNDDAVPRKLVDRFNVPVETVPEGIDGGAIVSNGRGLCASTIETFIAHSITLDEREATDALLGQIGCQVLALLPALAQERTKHADMFAQFIAADAVAIASFDPAEAPEDAERMDAAADMLREAALRLAIQLRVIPIPHPPPDEEIYYSYLNGLRVGHDFLVPSYATVSPAAETAAYTAFAEAWPDLQLVPIQSDDMILLYGAVHCVTLGLELPRIPLAGFSRQIGVMGRVLPMEYRIQ